jgi:Zn-dependent M28 family amino/carboxypeptidase
VRKSAIALGVTAVLAFTSLTPPSSPAAATDTVNTKPLRDAVTVSGILAHERVLQRIANQNGGTRASGMPGYKASVDYVAKTLKKAGYKVSKQKFTFPFYRELAPAELVIGGTAYETSTFKYSASGDLIGKVVPVNDLVIPPRDEANPSSAGCEAADFVAAPTEPAVALIQRGTCRFAVKVANAVAAGYDAVIFFNEGQPGRTELIVTGTVDGPVAVHVVSLSYEDGATVYAATQQRPIEASVVTATESKSDAKTYNVIADSPKGKNKDEVVVVSAHLDSVVEGPGINDNGSGVATILEIAEELRELRYTKKLQRQVRFIFFGAEEAGLLGSTHYLRTLSDRELSKIYANVNFDMLGSQNYARLVYDGDGSSTTEQPGQPTDAGPPGSEAIEDIFGDYFASLGLASEPTAFDGRSDYGPFVDAGIPAGGLFSGAEDEKAPEQVALYGGTAGVDFDACYHQACDTIGNLNTKALAELGDAAAHATLVLARSTTGLFPDGSRSARRSTRKAPTAMNHGGHDYRGHSLVR